MIFCDLGNFPSKQFPSKQFLCNFFKFDFLRPKLSKTFIRIHFAWGILFDTSILHWKDRRNAVLNSTTSIAGGNVVRTSPWYANTAVLTLSQIYTLLQFLRFASILERLGQENERYAFGINIPTRSGGSHFAGITRSPHLYNFPKICIYVRVYIFDNINVVRLKHNTC